MVFNTFSERYLISQDGFQRKRERHLQLQRLYTDIGWRIWRNGHFQRKQHSHGVGQMALPEAINVYFVLPYAFCKIENA